MDNTLNFLGLCKRAGSLVTGEDGALGAVRSGEAKLLLLASDAAQKNGQHNHQGNQDRRNTVPDFLHCSVHKTSLRCFFPILPQDSFQSIHTPPFHYAAVYGLSLTDLAS